MSQSEMFFTDRGTPEQVFHIRRARATTRESIIAFVKWTGIGRTMTMLQLDNFVRQSAGQSAPGTVSRIFRDLRKKGYFDYEVVSRSRSEYRITSIREAV